MWNRLGKPKCFAHCLLSSSFYRIYSALMYEEPSTWFYLKYNFRKCMHHCLQINKLRNFPDLKLIGNVFPLQRTLDMGFINLNLQNPTKGELLSSRKIGLTWICSVLSALISILYSAVWNSQNLTTATKLSLALTRWESLSVCTPCLGHFLLGDFGSL